MASSFARGDIVWCRLDPAKGHEQKKSRPCVIVSNNVLHNSGVVIICPLSQQTHKAFRGYNILLESTDKVQEPNTEGCPGANVVLIDQIRVLDIEASLAPNRVARVTDAAMAKIEAALVYVLDIAP